MTQSLRKEWPHIMGTSAVITSGKGGVGKSTVSVGLGRALAERGKRVLLIDCDAGLRSLDRMTGVEQELVFDISDVVYGRCAPIEAIYKCADNAQDGGLFLMAAPSSAENMIKPAVMEKLVPLLKSYYDYVLLDSPAGLGSGFKSASCAADRALIVCSPDPVCVRGTSSVKRLLGEMGVSEKHLVINKFNGSLFDKTGAYDDLDNVIDDSGVKLFGVVPEDFSLAAAFLRGKAADLQAPAMKAMSRLAGRFEGERIPISAI